MDRIWFHKRGLQWWRVLRISLLWGGLLVVLVLAIESPEVVRVAPPDAPATQPPATARISRSYPGVTAPVAVERARLPASAARAGKTDVCGVGAIDTSPSDPEGHAALESHRSGPALAAWLDSVIQGGDERARAAALEMRARVSAEHATRELARPDAACADNDACRKPFDELASATGERAAALWRDRLVQMAARTTDPAVYAYAVQACGAWQGPSRIPGCQPISLEQWARIDERNAVPWLYVANAARVRGDTAAVTEAMQRAAQADHTKIHGYSLVRSLVPDEPRGLSRAQAALLVGDLIGIQAAVALPYYTMFGTYCSEAALANAGQRDTCLRLAELMVRQGDTLTDLTVAARTGERLGWPKDRVAAIRSQANALTYAGIGWPLGNALSCETVERGRKHWLNVARVGERAAIMENVAASGLSLEELGRRNRAAFEASMRAVQTAPSTR